MPSGRRTGIAGTANGFEGKTVERGGPDLIPKRWPGIVPASVLAVAMVLAWTQWVWSRVAPAEPARSTVVQTHTSSAPRGDCPHGQAL